jgi:hypothetical protein
MTSPGARERALDERKRNAAFALAELVSRRGLERPCETLVAWAREA